MDFKRFTQYVWLLLGLLAADVSMAAKQADTVKADLRMSTKN